MFHLFVESHFSAAHRLRHYQGKCERLHGHNWQVRLFVSGEAIDPVDGMLIDFTLLKQALKDVLDFFDHRDLNELPFFADTEPSAEHLARIIAEEAAGRIDSPRARVSRVMVWEGPGSCAIYDPPGAPSVAGAGE